MAQPPSAFSRRSDRRVAREACKAHAACGARDRGGARPIATPTISPPSGRRPSLRDLLLGPAGGVAGAAVLLGFAFLGSRLLGAARAVVIADQYGATVELDAFWVAMRLPDLVFQLLAGATLAAAFIPVFARVLNDRGDWAAWRLASIVLNWVLIGTIALAVLIFMFADLIVPALAPGLGEDSGVREEVLNDAIFLTRVLLISPILFAISGMITGMLHARRHFLLPGIAPMLYNLGIILGALLLPERFGVEALAIGVIAGTGAHLLIQLPALSAVGARLRPSLSLGDPAVREVLRLMGPRMLGLAAAQINLIALTFFGSLVGDSSISALNFAWLILMFPVGLFGMSLATAIFPTLAERAATGGKEAVERMVSQVLRFTLFLSIPAGVGMLMLRDSIVKTLLEHGAFDSAATQLVSEALLFYSIALFAHAAIEILSRGFYVLGDTRTPVALAISSMLANLILAAALVDALELRGLALALSIATIGEALLLFVLLNLRLGGKLWSRALFGSIFKTVLASAVMAQVVFVLLELLGADPRFGADSWFAMLACAVSGAVVYGAVCLILRHHEASALFARVEQALSRVRG